MLNKSLNELGERMANAHEKVGLHEHYSFPEIANTASQIARRLFSLRLPPPVERSRAEAHSP